MVVYVIRCWSSQVQLSLWFKKYCDKTSPFLFAAVQHRRDAIGKFSKLMKRSCPSICAG